MKEGQFPEPLFNPKPDLEQNTDLILLNKNKEASVKLQEEYLDLVENWIIETRNGDDSYDRKLSNDERNLESVFGDINKPPSYIDRTREPKNCKIEEQRASEKVWVIVDFDDVINKTTTYHNFLKEKICSEIGLEPKEYERLYDESKIINSEDKKVLRFNLLVDKIKGIYPEDIEKIDKLFTEDINMNDFVDQGIKRALLALEKTFSVKKDIRISILTFGDINYQKGRIDNTNIVDAVDDIIYTEGSKREVLEALLENDYKSKGIIPPVVITLDDSKEQIKDYSEVNLQNNFINIHYKNPQGKKSMEESNVNQVLAIKENEKNEAALDFYRICKVCLNRDMSLSREELHEAFNNVDLNDKYHKTEISSSLTKERRTARRVDSTGFLNTIQFGNDNNSPEELKNRVIDNDGLTAWDYYVSLKDPVYPAFETNLSYSKDADGNLIRHADSHRYKKNDKGVFVEDNVYHREDRVGRIGNFVTNYHVEEFIKNAK